jgi:hypothetical protein
MPLPFDSKSHGTIAFGFFHIESDMLLLENLFFFAGMFYTRLTELAESDGRAPFHAYIEGYRISRREDIGDLTGAIHGTRYFGFIGNLYRRIPFPKRPDDFRQKGKGLLLQPVVESDLLIYGRRIRIPFIALDSKGDVGIGPYRFNPDIFMQLVNYVWLGGYPRWKDAVRPPYVEEMKKAIEKSRNPLFKTIKQLFS